MWNITLNIVALLAFQSQQQRYKPRGCRVTAKYYDSTSTTSKCCHGALLREQSSTSLSAQTRKPDTIIAVEPNGRVSDIAAWLELSSRSLFQLTGQTLYEACEVNHDDHRNDAVHHHERYAVLSHGIQDDPIYCYANRAALKQFQRSADEFCRLPSRCSAPDGAVLQIRQQDVADSVQIGIKRIESGVRVTKHGRHFRFRNLILWNVYNDDVRVGQTAIYDRALTEWLPDDNENDDIMSEDVS